MCLHLEVLRKDIFEKPLLCEVEQIIIKKKIKNKSFEISLDFLSIFLFYFYFLSNEKSLLLFKRLLSFTHEKEEKLQHFDAAT